MASVWKRGRYWYVSYFDRTGKRVTTSTHITNFRDARELGEKIEAKEILARRTGPSAAESRFIENEGVSITALLAAWKSDITARGNTAKHAHEQHFMVSTLLERMGAASMADIQPSNVSSALSSLRIRSAKEAPVVPHPNPAIAAIEGKKTKGVSLGTLNSYLRAMKSFTRWLWRDGRIPADPLAGMKGFRATTDRRHVRRALTLDEIRRLLKAADAGPEMFGVNGKDRGMLYRFMLGSGLRLGECRRLRVKHFQWNEKPVMVRVEAAYSKHRREDNQPIRSELAKVLKKWMASKRKRPDDVAFAIPDKPNRMLQADLAAAKIPAKDDRGRVIDIHALRHTFVTECARHFSPKVAQQLARHASITTTMDIYAHLEGQDVAKQLEGAKFYKDGA